MRRFFKSLVVGGRACWVMVAVVAVMLGWSGSRLEESTALAQSRSARAAGAPLGSGSASSGGRLISHFQEDPNGGPTRVILVDPQLNRMVVYHVPVDSGAIQLKSVRNFAVDFQVQAYNSDDPSTIDMERTLQRN